jgi:hypothetical protein
MLPYHQDAFSLKRPFLSTAAFLLLFLLLACSRAQGRPLAELTPAPEKDAPARERVSGSSAAPSPITPAACSPEIAFTHVPPYGSDDDLAGRVACIEPAAYRVAVYIYTGGWWNKPTFAEPLTPIASDGSWTADVTTGEDDAKATILAAFLLPVGYEPPQLAGAATLPASLFTDAAAQTHVERTRRTITFSGRVWNVKASDTPVGPGPNYFSDAAEDVWVDGNGRLHLKIRQRDGVWYSTEVFTQAPLGRGTYRFYTDSAIDQLDENIVLGLFTWDTLAATADYREIDIEFSRWGDAANDNAQFVVQPWDAPGNLYRFDVTLSETAALHQFTWGGDDVAFASAAGHAVPPAPDDLIATWRYTDTAGVPPDGPASARINFWLFNGDPPADGEEAEVIIEAFTFTPPGQLYLPLITHSAAPSGQ